MRDDDVIRGGQGHSAEDLRASALGLAWALVMALIPIAAAGVWWMVR